MLPQESYQEDFRRFVVEMDENDIAVANVYLIEDIKEPMHYLPILKMLVQMKETDTVIFHINSAGGYVSGALTLTNAIKETKANTIANVTAAASAATLITFACDKVICHFETEFMIHDRTSGSYGTGKENRKRAQHEDSYFMHLTSKFYKGFLSQDEIVKINTDADTEWFFGEELNKRMKRWAKINGTKYEYKQ